jgi:hypothetical protein
VIAVGAAIERRRIYSHIVHILTFTSTGVRVVLLASSFNFASGHDRLRKCLLILLGMKRVRCA